MNSLSACGPEENYIALAAIDNHERCWIAGNKGGVQIYKSQEDCQMGQKIKKLYPDLKFICFFEDSRNFIWLGVENGMVRCSPNLSETTFVPLTDGLQGYSIFAISEDHLGNIWFGGWNTGLMCLPVNSKCKSNLSQSDLKVFSKEKKGKEHILSNVIWTMKKDSSGKLWVSAGDYLLTLSEDGKSFNNLGQEVAGIFALTEYPKGTLWMGTSGKGLVKRTADGKKRIYKYPGKMRVTIYSMIEKSGKLWMGTGEGLICFDPETGLYHKFGMADGLPSETFVKSAVTEDSYGNLLFGSTEGLISFFPQDLKISNTDPEVRLTDVRLFNESISLEKSDKHLLNTTLDRLEELKLDYSQNFFSLSFSVLQHSLPQKIRFIYRLKGFNDNWFIADPSRSVSYTNLSPGKYTFYVKTLLENGNQGKKETSLKIIILPPWWKTLWFRLLACFSLAAFVVGFL